MAQKLSKRKELWEVVIPEPFKIDPILRKEDLIQTMSNFENSDEMNTFLFECLAPPERRIIMSASEYDIFNNLWVKDSIFEVSMVRDDGKYVVVIKDKDENILGKGEINRLGKKMTVDAAKEMLSSEMNDFSERYENGMKEIESLVFQAQTLRENIIKNQEIKENN